MIQSSRLPINKDGDEEEPKPSKAQDLVISDSRIETRAATLPEFPSCVSSSKKYIVRFEGNNSKKRDGREIV